MGWEDGLVGNCLLCHYADVSLDLKNPHKTLFPATPVIGLPTIKTIRHQPSASIPVHLRVCTQTLEDSKDSESRRALTIDRSKKD